MKAQQSSDRPQDFNTDFRVFVTDLVEASAGQGEQGGIGACFDGGSAGKVADDGHLSNGTAGGFNGDFFFSLAVITFQHVKGSVNHEADFIARVAFTKDDISGFKSSYMHVVADFVEFIEIQVGENRNAGQAVDDGFFEQIFWACRFQLLYVLGVKECLFEFGAEDATC